MSDNKPVISCIIHFLNSERYLSQAIESVFRQTFTDWELLLVDGGSNDNSVNIANSYQQRFPNKIRVLEYKGPGRLGIFSSRIWGAKEARAPILAHLDSDDEWHPQFLERHYAIYQSVFGSKKGMLYCPMVIWWDDPVLAIKSYIQQIPASGLHQPPDLLLDFIKEGYARSAGNSSVMIAREIVIEAADLIGIADEKAVEDQFLWSYVILKYPIFISPEPLVRYRQWSNSTCALTKYKELNQITLKHLEWLLTYIQRHHLGLVGEDVISAVKKTIFIEKIKNRELLRDFIKSLFNKNFKSILLYYDVVVEFIRKVNNKILQVINGIMKPLTRLRIVNGIKPLSYDWASDRGFPIHRYYIEQFLKEFKSDIMGNCLEFHDSNYVNKFGIGRAADIDILHIDNSNPRATIVADLTRPNEIPSNKFDCIVCTHVLHIVLDLEKFVAELYRILKPGGVLLVAVPSVSMCDSKFCELWRFTPEGLEVILAKFFGKEYVTIRAFGNSLTAAGEIRGFVASEFTPFELNQHDTRFSVEVCARAIKRSV